MNDKQRVQACFAALLMIPALAWFMTVKLVYGFTPQTIRDDIVYYAQNTFTLWPLWTALSVGVLLGIVICVLIVIYSKSAFAGAHFKKFYRGTELVTAAALSRLTREKGPQSTLAGIPIPRKVEGTHFSIGGSTGTGKSTLFNELMVGCIKRGHRMVILDPDGDFLSRFYRPGDRILNPYDIRTEGWSFFNEIREDFDFERYAVSMIQKSSSNDAEEWNDYGRLLFREVARKLYSTTRNPSMEDVFSWTNEKPVEELQEYVKGTRAVSLFTGNDRATGSVRFVLSNKLSPHLKMPQGKFSLRTWLEDPAEGNLFITWDESMKHALRPLISAWTDTIISSVLGMSSATQRKAFRRLWLFLDELESLNHLPTLGDALTKGRKKGLTVVSGYQDYNQLISVYGEHLAETMLSNHRSMVALGVGRMGTSTSKRMADALGEHEVKRDKEGMSRKFGQMGTRSESEELKPENVVMRSELVKLPDLEGYLSFAGNYPVAKIKFEPLQFTRSEPVPGILRSQSQLAGF